MFSNIVKQDLLGECPANQRTAYKAPLAASSKWWSHDVNLGDEVS